MKEKEIRKLLEDSKRTIENGGSLTGVFEKTGKSCKMAAGSVRNFYYSLIKRAQTDKKLVKRFPALESLGVRKKKVFSKEEEYELVKKIDEETKGGKSVRRVIKEMSMGDEKLALRFQNKYRNATSCRREREPSPYRKICAAIDSLIEKLIAVRLEDDGVARENERLKNELATLKNNSSRSKAVEYFSRRDKKTRTDKK